MPNSVKGLRNVKKNPLTSKRGLQSNDLYHEQLKVIGICMSQKV